MIGSHMKKGIAVIAALAVIAFFFAFNIPFNTATNATGDTPSATAAQTASTAGLVVQDESVGAGEPAQNGDTVSVNYTLKLQDGTIVDSSAGKAPFSFTLGKGEVIPGWELGIVGMKVGGKRLLIVPPGLGYGDQTFGPIPANSTLIFEVELVKSIPSLLVPALNTTQ